MKQRQLGTHGLRVSSIGLGTRAWDANLSPETAAQVLRRFVSAGGTLIDVTPATHFGAAQRLLGTVLPDFSRDDLVLSLSLGVDPEAPVGRRVDCSRRNLFRQLDRSLAELGLTHVDLVSAEYWDGATPPAEVADTLEAIVRSGRARYAGLRGYEGWQLAVTPSPVIAAAGAEYSLIDRSAERGILPAAQFLGLGFIASSPLGQGILTGKYRDGVRPTDAEVLVKLDQRSSRIVDALGTAATGLGIAPATAALAWALGRPGVSSTLVSVSSPEQLDDVLPAATVTLATAIVSALDEISAV
ncbi:aldo/keto reductase [Corynebacterium sp. H128]|uniref:aldo/keto reductase n=1 Tax=unclassified Corynebacterium TaxID=2624378 RepID=UPI0030992E0C